MKFLRFFLSLIVAGAMFSSCQKELSVEAGTATGTLKFDGTGDCLPILINGTYQKDTLLNATNYIDVQVDIIETGNYSIFTDTLNGYSFSATGQVAESGLNTIRLKGTGRPIAAGVDVFTVHFSGTTCQVNIVVTASGSTGGTSVFTLGGSPGTCTGAGLSGTYTAGTAMTASNTATIDVNVTTIGTYTITSSTVNGVTFSGSGTFAATGPASIVLTATGTPLAATTSNFTLTSAATNCSFSVIFNPGASGTSVFTLGGSPGTCTGATLSGTYTAGTAMTASNTVTVNVNVTTVGTYTITSSTVNGVTFGGTGTFAATGPASIVLTATGTPLAATTSNFTLTAGASTCTFSVVFAAAAPTGYTLNCATPVLAGTYTADVPMTAANTMTIGVNVTTGGAYNITSTCVNGVTFAGSGTLPATPASQTVTLTATGTPAVAGTFTYPLTGGSSTCNVSVTFGASTATDFIKATINGVPFTFNNAPDAVYDNTSIPGVNFVDIFGASTTCGNPEMDLVVAVATPGLIPPGTYTVNATTYQIFGYYLDAIGDEYYDTNDGTTHPAPVLTIIVTSSTATRIAGTFSGAIYLDGTGPGLRTITNGSFNVPVH